jgi:hypothetical protein
MFNDLTSFLFRNTPEALKRNEGGKQILLKVKVHYAITDLLFVEKVEAKNSIKVLKINER